MAGAGSLRGGEPLLQGLRRRSRLSLVLGRKTLQQAAKGLLQLRLQGDHYRKPSELFGNYVNAAGLGSCKFPPRPVSPGAMVLPTMISRAMPS